MAERPVNIGGLPDIPLTELLANPSRHMRNSAPNLMRAAESIENRSLLDHLIGALRGKRNEYGETVKELALDMTPILGEARDAYRVADSTEALAKALSNSDWRGAKESSIDTVINGLGLALPFISGGALMGSIKRVGNKLDDLPMDKASRLARAKDLGFDTNKVLYHGTAKTFPEFSMEQLGKNTRAKSAKQGVWMVKDPNTAHGYAKYGSESVPIQELIDKANAMEKIGDWDKYDDYLRQAEELEMQIGKYGGTGQNIIPLYKKGKYKTVDANGAEFTDIQDIVNDSIFEAKKSGFDGVTFNNLADDVYFNGRPTEHTIVFDPKNIRSTQAKFDPSKKDSANLLASALMGTILGKQIMSEDKGNN